MRCHYMDSTLTDGRRQRRRRRRRHPTTRRRRATSVAKVPSTGATTASDNARRSSTSATTSGSVDGESVLTASDDTTAKIWSSNTGDGLAKIARHGNSVLEPQNQTGSTLPRSFQRERLTTGSQESCSVVGTARGSTTGPSRQVEAAGLLASALKTSRGPAIPRASDACGHAIAGEKFHRHNFAKPAERLVVRWADEATSDGD